ncbi:unnamed protein product [Gongylonema pulchrum]|uniref:Centromere protein L n=1 Tax=Gongylonema pulchrum TaxID=637853 RepID=A0A183EZG6_9BILA|nr:unnamed protein product [Gongylonema pulchrum]
MTVHLQLSLLQFSFTLTVSHSIQKRASQAALTKAFEHFLLEHRKRTPCDLDVMVKEKFLFLKRRILLKAADLNLMIRDTFYILRIY